MRIHLGANPFLLLWCIEIKNKEKNKLASVKEPVNLFESIMCSQLMPLEFAHSLARYKFYYQKVVL